MEVWDDIWKTILFGFRMRPALRLVQRTPTTIFRRCLADNEAKRRMREWPPLDFNKPPEPRRVTPLKALPTVTPDDPYYKSLQDPDYFRVADMFTVRHLMEARVHYGHKMGTLNDKMKPFLIGERLGVCIFDLDQTAVHLRRALNFVAHMAYRSGIVVFFGGDR